MQKVLYTRDIQSVSEFVDSAVISYINEGQIETFESFSTFDIIAFDWYDVRHLDRAPGQIMIYLDADDLFFLCENEYAYNKAAALFKPADSNERALYSFFRALLRDDGQLLEQLEEQVTAMEDGLLDGSRRTATGDIMALRRRLLRLKRYYEQLDGIFEELTENDNDLIQEDALRHFIILGSRMDRLLRSVGSLRDYVTQLREAYQAQVDIEQNKLMKVFTVVTAVFLPLTLIVGWYGMNLKMPEYGWEFGYPLVIVLSVAVCAVCVWFFKKRSWL